MKKVIFSTFVAGMLALNVGINHVSASSSFSDVSKEDYYYFAIEKLKSQNIANGVGGDIFAPGQNVTRAQTAAFITRTLKLEVAPDWKEMIRSFSDVNPNDPLAPAIGTAYKHGILKGNGPDTFGPQLPLTREQMASVIVRGFKLDETMKDKAKRPADESSISPYHKQDVITLYQNNITKGIDQIGTYNPRASVTRGQMAAFLDRLLMLQTPPSEFTTRQMALTIEELKANIMKVITPKFEQNPDPQTREPVKRFYNQISPYITDPYLYGDFEKRYQWICYHCDLGFFPFGSPINDLRLQVEVINPDEILLHTISLKGAWEEAQYVNYKLLKENNYWKLDGIELVPLSSDDKEGFKITSEEGKYILEEVLQNIEGVTMPITFIRSFEKDGETFHEYKDKNQNIFFMSSATGFFRDY